MIYGMQIADELLHEEFPVFNIEGLGEIRATLNLGIMQGGVAYNIVPDECALWFDRRTVPGETQETVLTALQDTLKKYNKIPDISVQAEIARPDWNWEPIRERGLLPAMTEIDSTLVHVVKKTHQEHAGVFPEIYFTDGYNEMDFLINDLAIPTVNYGPGDGGLCHTDHERLDIRQLETAASVYNSIIHMTCGRINTG